MNKEIIQVYKEFNMTYIEIINTNNLERWTYGNIDDLPYKGLYLNLLDDENKVRNLIGMVEADDEPQTWRQGDLALLVFRREEKLVCMFYCTSKRGIESYQYEQEIFSRFQEIANMTILQ